MRLVIDRLGLPCPHDHRRRRSPSPIYRSCWRLPVMIIWAQGKRRLHAGARALSLPRYLGSARPGLRRFWLQPLHVGHRLDPRSRNVDLQAGRRRLSRRRSSVAERSRRAYGRDTDADLQLDEGAGLRPRDFALGGTCPAQPTLSSRRGPLKPTIEKRRIVMKVVTLKDIPHTPMEGAEPIQGYAGPVSRSRQTIIPPGDSANYNCSVVNFSQGSTTGWHTHSCDQVLIVTSGSGMVATA